jgi:hypothetical protein
LVLVVLLGLDKQVEMDQFLSSVLLHLLVVEAALLAVMGKMVDLEAVAVSVHQLVLFKMVGMEMFLLFLQHKVIMAELEFGTLTHKDLVVVVALVVLVKITMFAELVLLVMVESE